MISGKEKERQLIIKLYNEKKTCRGIASTLGTSKSKASYWINRYKKTGILTDIPRSGRPTKLNQKKLDNIYTTLREEESKNNRSGFSSKRVSELIEKATGKKYTLRHVRRVLEKMNIGLITPRVSHIRKDEKKIKQFKKDFKKNSTESMWTTYLSHSTKLDLG